MATNKTSKAIGTKQKLLLGGFVSIVAAAALVGSMYMDSNKGKTEKQKRDEKPVEYNYTGAIPKEVTRDGEKVEYKANQEKLKELAKNLSQENATTKAEMTEAQKKVVELEKKLDAKINELAKANATNSATLNAMTGGKGAKGAPGKMPDGTPPVPGAQMQGAFANPGATISTVNVGVGAPTDISSNAMLVPGQRPGETMAEFSRRNRREQGLTSVSEAFRSDEPLNFNRAGGRAAKSYLTATTRMTVDLLNGADAPTGTGQTNAPMPVTMRVKGPARLPNGYLADLKDCSITAYAYGDLSSERAIFRTDRLACIDENGGAIDVPIKGYIVGPDGKNGVRGTLVSKTGQALANALYAAVGSGIGNAFRALGAVASTSTLTGVSTSTYSNPGDAFKAGAGQGAAQGFDKVAQYYLNLADKMHPVIAVDAGIECDVVLSAGVSIERK